MGEIKICGKSIKKGRGGCKGLYFRDYFALFYTHALSYEL